MIYHYKDNININNIIIKSKLKYGDGYIFNPIKIDKSKNLDEEKKEITIKINETIERMILKNPEQWIWTHNRWK